MIPHISTFRADWKYVRQLLKAKTSLLFNLEFGCFPLRNVFDVFWLNLLYQKAQARLEFELKTLKKDVIHFLTYMSLHVTYHRPIQQSAVQRGK